MMLRFKQWLAGNAVGLLGSFELESSFEVARAAVQAALSQRDMATVPLRTVLSLWLAARNIERYAYHSRKRQECQEVLRELRN